MNEKKRLNYPIIVLAVLLTAVVALCAVLWSGMKRAEKTADEQKKQYAVLLEEKEDAEKQVREYKEKNASLLKEKEDAEKLAEEYEAQYNALLEEKNKAEQEAADLLKASEQYGNDLRDLSDLMLHGGVTTERCGNLVQKVWHNSIYKIKDTETDAFTLDASGNFYSDFNTALDNLYADDAFVKDLQSIRDNRSEVEEKIRGLKNPPSEWQSAYDELLLFYDCYYDFTELVLYSNCSLNEFKEMFSKYDTDGVKHYNKLSLYF